MLLPEEIQLHIISFLRFNEVKSVKLVCKSFYTYCCKLQSFQYPLVITKRKLEDNSIFNSILTTRIKFNQLIVELDHFTLNQLQQVMAIVIVHGSFIRTLLVDKCNYLLKSLGESQSALVTWLSYMPKLEYTSFSYFESVGIPNFINSGDESILNLPRLERVRFPPYAFASVLHRLPKSTLESLLLANATPLPNLGKIFERHRETLKELEFFCFFPYTDSTIFHQLQLEILHFHAPQANISNQFLNNVLIHQTKLKSLSLGETGSNEAIYASEELLRTICGLKEMQKLEIAIANWTPAHALSQFARLTKLEKIRIEIPDIISENDNSRLVVFSQTCIPKLKSLELRSMIYSEHMWNLRNNYRNLEAFHGDLFLSDDEEEEMGSFNFILDSFPKLRKLVLLESYYTFMLSSAQYKNLEVLRLWCESGCMNISPDLIKAVPNLKVLQVDALEARIETFEAILASKINHCLIKIPFRRLKNVVQLKKLKNKILQKCHCCLIKIVK